jgi:hypothetical protein
MVDERHAKSKIVEKDGQFTLYRVKLSYNST